MLPSEDGDGPLQLRYNRIQLFHSFSMFLLFLLLHLVYVRVEHIETLCSFYFALNRISASASASPRLSELSLGRQFTVVLRLRITVVIPFQCMHLSIHLQLNV